jgi:hypothetical protein
MPESEVSREQQKLDIQKERNRQLEEMNKTLALIAEQLKTLVAAIQGVGSILSHR